jgi:hypothetical protein
MGEMRSKSMIVPQPDSGRGLPLALEERASRPGLDEQYREVKALQALVKRLELAEQPSRLES